MSENKKEQEKVDAWFETISSCALYGCMVKLCPVNSWSFCDECGLIHIPGTETPVDVGDILGGTVYVDVKRKLKYILLAFRTSWAKHAFISRTVWKLADRCDIWRWYSRSYKRTKCMPDMPFHFLLDFLEQNN
jgi:hypothetical protein